jgi:hypothetical protein
MLADGLLLADGLILADGRPLADAFIHPDSVIVNNQNHIYGDF